MFYAKINILMFTSKYLLGNENHAMIFRTLNCLSLIDQVTDRSDLIVYPFKVTYFLVLFMLL